MVFVTGDLHGNFERFKPKYFPEQARMTRQDIMICAGDFGGVGLVTVATMKRWTGWNACPSRLPLSAATMKTMTRWSVTPWRSGTAARYMRLPHVCT
ncbi:MAG: hypothetical protein ACLSGI_04770 [Butyricicoccaceae bacterium]